ncbi:methylated-DNA--[protein]-cysteine S-methyltransferase [Gallibacterium genomosp. 3]|uniref:Methylated-DNA--protein-cysteine methyltransferase n=1 Tax=Gallibacterium genomosp. 3 TaxID=505345 RepID=A0A1A7Q7B3_9PAST|nr:methylated-DNA--[protein]-cysteine S-methyltransferase [Gallibacterium genomosp. 3]OBX09310.1 cysteine methyltransferase [Gallibacterium genomosp. 3]
MKERIFLHTIDSPVGKLQLLAHQHHLVGVLFERENEVIQPHWLCGRDHPVLQQTEQALTRYFSGEHQAFTSLPLKLLGTDFQQAVWHQLLQIPFGQTATYADIAQRIGKPKAVRAVGGAVGRNPISIIVPCHRILGKQQQLTGFGGGLPAKRYLLQHENITFIDKGIEFVNPKHWNRLEK